VLRHVSWSVIPLVAGLFVLVRAVERTGLIDTVTTAFMDVVARTEVGAAVLAAGVVALIAVNALIGLAGLRRATREDPVLRRLQRDLARVKGVEQWIVLSGHPLPLPLHFTVASVWPRAERSTAESWDAVLSRALASHPSRQHKLMVVEWDDRAVGGARFRVPGVMVQMVGEPRYLWKGRLRTFMVLGQPPTAPRTAPQP
jgi:hypothetical protein